MFLLRLDAQLEKKQRSFSILTVYFLFIFFIFTHTGLNSSLHEASNNPIGKQS